MATVDSIDAFSLLQNMAPMSYDSSRLVDVACIAYAHVDDAHIKELRGKFLPTVQRQFQVALVPTLLTAMLSVTYPGDASFCSVKRILGDLHPLPAPPMQFSAVAVLLQEKYCLETQIVHTADISML